MWNERWANHPTSWWNGSTRYPWSENPQVHIFWLKQVAFDLGRFLQRDSHEKLANCSESVHQGDTWYDLKFNSSAMGKVWVETNGEDARTESKHNDCKYVPLFLWNRCGVLQRGLQSRSDEGRLPEWFVKVVVCVHMWLHQSNDPLLNEASDAYPPQAYYVPQNDPTSVTLSSV